MYIYRQYQKIIVIKTDFLLNFFGVVSI